MSQVLDPEGFHWSVTEELLAVLCELADQGNRLFYMANSKKEARQPKPIQIKRPHREAPQAKPKATSKDVARFFGKSIKHTPKAGE